MTTLPVAEARSNFSSLVEQASKTHERFEITRNGVRAAVLLGVDDYDAMLGTLAILSDAELVKQIGQGLHDLERGDTFDAEQVKAARRPAAGME